MQQRVVKYAIADEIPTALASQGCKPSLVIDEESKR
jgi:hypothetical protein